MILWLKVVVFVYFIIFISASFVLHISHTKIIPFSPTDALRSVFLLFICELVRGIKKKKFRGAKCLGHFGSMLNAM